MNKLKKLLYCLLTLIMLLPAALQGRAFAAPDNSAGAAILIHGDTGQVLYEKNAGERMLVASTTKIMTALVVVENCDPDEIVTILPEHAAVEGSSMYLKAGGEYTVSDLLYGLMLASGNDAASALAYHCGGSDEGFAQMMNEKAQALGLLNTSFKNPHGLDAQGHYSSAADLAVITAKALENELFAEIVSTKTHTIGEQTYMNHNKLLWRYEGAIGVKTGYTMAAGRSLVSGAERNGLRLICVTLSDPDDWSDHTALYDWAFENFEYARTMPAGRLIELPLISGEKSSVGIACRCDSRLLVDKNKELSLSLELPEFVYAGVKEGECAGRAFIMSDGETIGEFPLIYDEDAPLSKTVKLSPWERFRQGWFLVNKYSLVFKGSD